MCSKNGESEALEDGGMGVSGLKRFGDETPR
jgi:hypothetical protein